jgi:hypothetical protein
MQTEGYKLKYTNNMRFVSFVVIGSHCRGLEICEILCRLVLKRPFASSAGNVIFSSQQINSVLFQRH